MPTPASTCIYSLPCLMLRSFLGCKRQSSTTRLVDLAFFSTSLTDCRAASKGGMQMFWHRSRERLDPASAFSQHNKTKRKIHMNNISDNHQQAGVIAWHSVPAKQPSQQRQVEDTITRQQSSMHTVLHALASQLLVVVVVNKISMLMRVSTCK